MKKIFLSICMIMMLSLLVGCSKHIDADYDTAEDFEQALNNGEVLEGKTVTFNVNELRPNSLLGFNVFTGEHLNFISEKNPGAKVGQQMTVKVTEVTSMLGSWIIKYELLNIEGDAVQSDSSTIDNRKDEASNKDVSDKDFEVKSYSYNWYGDEKIFLAIKNNSETAVGIDISAVAKDKDGNMVGVANGSIVILGPSEESIASISFDNVDNYDSIEYSYSYNKNVYYKPVIKDLSLNKTINNKNVIVSVTNNGTNAAEFVEAYALFLDSNGKVVDFDSTYVVDSVFEIKPGATINKQLDTYESFNDVVIYLTGRR